MKLLSLLAALIVPALAAEKRPNLLLIHADDMGYSDPGYYGSGIDTPHLDQLASEGLRFSRFHNTGRCCPSRACLMTGVYPHQAGVGHMLGKTKFPAYSDDLDPEVRTLPETLRDAGYDTFMSGKWHLGWSDSGAPEARRFNRFFGSRGYVDSYFDIIPRTYIYLNNEITLPSEQPPHTRFIRTGSTTPRTSTPASYTDLLPTFAAASGATPPENLDGINLLPALAGEAKPAPRDILLGVGAVVSGQWKLHGKQLFDLSVDAREQHDVSAANPAVRKRLLKSLGSFRTLRGPAVRSRLPLPDAWPPVDWKLPEEPTNLNPEP